MLSQFVFVLKIKINGLLGRQAQGPWLHYASKYYTVPDKLSPRRLRQGSSYQPHFCGTRLYLKPITRKGRLPSSL
jgi:hypothetical protein